MVVFTCNACSAVLKRNKVDNHCYQCRGCESLSCVDCGKDFWGNDYQNHTKCISEEEKYGRKDSVQKVNKGEAKQDQWIEQVQAAIEKASSKPSLKRLLERLKQYPNIPRKKAKFENFVKNSLKCYDTSLTAASWDVLMTSKSQSQNENGDENVADPSSDTTKQEKEEGHADDESLQSNAPKNKKERKEERRKKSQKEKKDKTVEALPDNTDNDVSKKSKKRKRNESEDVEDENVQNGDTYEGDKMKKKKKNKTVDIDICNTDNGLKEEEQEETEPPRKRKKAKFDWDTVIKTILEKKGELSLKKLKKKVLSEFSAQDAANYSEENLSAKFDKKVTKIEGVKVSKDRAYLKA